MPTFLEMAQARWQEEAATLSDDEARQKERFRGFEGAAVPFVTPNTGEVVYLAGDQAAQARADGWSELDPTQERRYRYGATMEDTFSDHGVLSFGQGILRGGTAGLSDFAGAAMGLGPSMKYTRDYNPGEALVGELGGAVTTSLLTGGAGAVGSVARALPVGRAALLGGKIAGLGRGAGLGRAALATGAAGLVEGGIYGAGSFISDVALENKPLAAESFVGAMGQGALWGAGAGVALTAAGRGFRRVGQWRADRAARSADEFASTAAAQRRVKEAERLRTWSMKEDYKLAGRQVLEEQRIAGRKDVAGITGQARETVARTRASGQVQAAEQRAIAAGERRAAAEARVRGRVGAEEAKLQREIVRGDWKTKQAEIYSGGWRDANRAKIVQREISRDARVRSAAMKEMGKAGDTLTVKQLIPDHMLRDGAEAVASQEADSAVSRMLETSDDMVSIADDVIATTGDPRVIVARQNLINSLDESAAWVAKTGGDDIAESAAVIGQQEKALHEAAEALDQYMDDATKAAMAESQGAYAQAAEKKGGALGLMADVGAGLEALEMVGISTPLDVDRLPVVGPVLGAYLKLRALTRGGAAVAGKLGIKVPGSPLAAVAQKGVQFQNRAGRALKSFAKGVETAGRKAGPVGVAAVLSSPLVRQGRSDAKGKSNAELFEKRSEELFRAISSREETRSRVMAQVSTGVPELDEAVVATVDRKLEHLHKTMPKDPRPPQAIPVGRAKWQPSPSDLQKWARIVRAAEDPLTLIKDMEAGRLSTEAVQAVKAVYPELYAHLQRELVTELSDLRKDLPYRKRVQLSTLFEVPVEDTMRPEFLFAVQSNYQRQPEQMQQGEAPTISPQEDLGANRRAGM